MPDLTKQQFIARFVEYMCKHSDFTHFDDGQSVADYAHGVAIICWEDPDRRADGPESCAEADMGYHGEE